MFLYALGCIFACTSSKAEKSGAEVYSTYCVHCHQENGQGVAKRYPPLAGSEWLTGTKLIKIVLHGLHGDIVVRGETYSNVMGPWGYALSDSEVAGVVNHIRSSWGNQLAPTNIEEVGRIRKKYEGRHSWTAAELESTDK